VVAEEVLADEALVDGPLSDVTGPPDALMVLAPAATGDHQVVAAERLDGPEVVELAELLTESWLLRTPAKVRALLD
jgi:hypothetical protein